MSKVEKPDRSFIYFSPLKNCENKEARQLASLVELFLIDNIDLQIKFAACRVEQIYKYADKFMKRKLNV